MNKLDLEKWQTSKVRYPVHEDSEFDLRKQLNSEFICRPFVDFLDKQLEKGIDISHLRKRIEVVEEMNQCDGCKRNIPITDGVHKDDKTFGIGCTKNRYSYIKLKPIQEEESPIRELDLYTLERIKFMFEIHSDNSARCNGYNSLVRTINDIKSKQP